MSKIVKYDVLREHEGDRHYRRGEKRDLDENEARHLVELCVLVEAHDDVDDAPEPEGGDTRWHKRLDGPSIASSQIFFIVRISEKFHAESRALADQRERETKSLSGVLISLYLTARRW